MSAASIVDRRVRGGARASRALREESTAPADVKAAAKRAEDEHYAGRLVDAYCAGDSLVRAMLGLPLAVTS